MIRQTSRTFLNTIYNYFLFNVIKKRIFLNKKINIHVFGDSHGRMCFQGLDCINHSTNAITMHRVGRDKLSLLNFSKNNVKNNDAVILIFGEIDCRCHIKKQILLNREYNAIISELVDEYIKAIEINVAKYKKLDIILCSIVPPTRQSDFEKINEPISHEFPFIGTDKERVKFTQDINELLKVKCTNNKYTFLDFHNDYCDKEGLLNFELSDQNVHIKENKKILDKLDTIIIALNRSNIE